MLAWKLNYGSLAAVDKKFEREEAGVVISWLEMKWLGRPAIKPALWLGKGKGGRREGAPWLGKGKGGKREGIIENIKR